MRLIQYITESVSVKVNNKTIRVVKPNRSKGDSLVYVDVKTFDKAFSKERDYYIGKGGVNSIGGRYKMFGMFIDGGEMDGIPFEPHDEIESPEVYIDSDGRVSFTNGRHRWAWLRDQGAKRIPVTMPEDSIINAKKFGMI